MNNNPFKPSTKKVNSFPSNPLAKINLLQLAIDSSYTLLEETSQANFFMPYM